MVCIEDDAFLFKHTQEHSGSFLLMVWIYTIATVSIGLILLFFRFTDDDTCVTYSPMKVCIVSAEAQRRLLSEYAVCLKILGTDIIAC